MALQAEQLLCGAGKEKRVGLGPALFKLASSVHVDLTVFVRPILEKLTERAQESVNLLVFDDGSAVCIAHSASDQELQVIPKLGAKLHLYCTASGKALLAAMPEEEAKRIAGAPPWKALTANTLTSWNSLSADLDKVRISGFAYDLEEHANGICAIAASVRTNCGTLYAISIPTPTQRFQKKVNALQRELGKAKQEVDKLIRDHGI